ncbi:MAG TPA: hypothetical protein VJ792_00360 [Candidatus Nitrosotalea sp.]|nr:hypothetical protein [Candidatus Nitrosotalea sp.]
MGGLGSVQGVGLFCLVAVVAGAGLVPASFGDGFQPPLFKWSYKPAICIFEPSDPNFPGLGQEMVAKVQDALIEWQTKLNSGNANGPWNLKAEDISYQSAQNFDSSGCDISVNFKPSPDDPNEKFVEAGVTSYRDFPKVTVTIYYLGVGLKEQYQTFWQNGTLYYAYQPIPYFTGYLASSPQLDMTIRHELGHALGLGHYIVRDDELVKIVQGTEDMPSIMVTTVFAYGVTHFDITPLDVQEVRSIYGQGGIQEKPPQSPGVGQGSIPLPATNNATVTQNATAPSSRVQEIKSQLPQWIKTVARWWSEGKVSDGDFAGSMGYLVGQGILKVPKVQAVLPSGQIPPWVVQNAGQWADGKISDYEFLRGIQYMVGSGIIRP